MNTMKSSPLAAIVFGLVMGVAVPSLSPAQNEVNREIKLNEWVATPGPIGDFAPINLSYTGSVWKMRPNSTTPDFCFGWLEGPLVTIDSAADELLGNDCGFIVEYEFRTDVGGQAPELRLRVNTEDFGQYAIAGVANPRFQQLRTQGGKGVATVSFDRTQISTATRFRLYIDLLSALPPGSVNPLWEITIRRVDFFTTVSNSSFGRADLINLAYLEGDDGDIAIHAGGDNDRSFLWENPNPSRFTSFAYDGAFAIILYDDDLYGYTPLNNFSKITIDTSNVVSAAISDQHVLYIDSSNGMRYYNLITDELVDFDKFGRDFFAVTASGDGTLLALDLRSDNSRRIWQLDPRRDPLQFVRIEDDDTALFVNGRNTGVRSDRKQAADLSAPAPAVSGTWPLFE